MSLLLLYQGASTTKIGTLSVTGANDTLSSTGTVAIKGTLSATEAADTISSGGTAALKGTLSVAVANDTIAATGAIALKSAGSITAANDTSSAAGAVALVGAAAIIEGSDALTGPAIVPVLAQLAATEDSDSVSSSFFPVLQIRPRGGPWPIPGDEPVWRRDLWDRDLRRVIEEAWRIANGEIDPVTRVERPPPPEPDYAAVHEALAARATAAERDQVDQIVAARERLLEDEAIAILLLAA